MKIAGTATLPFDVVKTHKQIEMGEVDFKVKGTGTGISEFLYLFELYLVVLCKLNY